MIAVFKFTLQRGYSYCNTALIGIIGATAIKPYLDPYIQLHLWQLIAITVGGFLFIGYLDRIFDILDEEQSYLTEKNRIMMGGLYGDKDKDGKQN